MVFYNGRIVREDRVIEKGSVRIEDGKIVEMDTPTEVFEDPKNEKTRAFLQHSLERLGDV